MATFGGRKPDRAFLSSELRLHRCKAVRVMALNEKILYKNLKREFPTKENFLEGLGVDLNTILDESGEVSENSAPREKLMNSYLYSYWYMVQSCKKFSENEGLDIEGKTSDSVVGVHDLVEAVLMVYSWMPRALQFNCWKKPDPEKFAEALAFLPKLRQEKAVDVWREMERDVLGATSPDGDEGKKKGNLETLLEMLEGSMVALSKFLHFLNPDLFPMYDSNVARVLHRRVYTVEDYIIYSKCFERVCREFYLNEEGFRDDVRWREDLSRKVSEKAEKFNKEFGCKITPIRSMELILFRRGRKMKEESSVDNSEEENNHK